MFNETAVIPALVARLRPVLDALAVDYEVVAVDDGSTGRRPRRCCSATAGLAATAGAPAAPQQRSPGGADRRPAPGPRRVRGQHRRRPPGPAGDHRRDARRGPRRRAWTSSTASAPTAAPTRSFKRNTARGYYWLMRRLVGVDLPAQAGDFRLLSRDAVEVLRGAARAAARSTGCWCRRSASPAPRCATSGRSAPPARRSIRCAGCWRWPGQRRPTSPPRRCAWPPGWGCRLPALPRADRGRRGGLGPPAPPSPAGRRCSSRCCCSAGCSCSASACSASTSAGSTPRCRTGPRSTSGSTPSTDCRAPARQRRDRAEGGSRTPDFGSVVGVRG